MQKRILAGCDLHDKNMLVCAGCGGGTVQKKVFSNTAAGRKTLVSWLHGMGENMPVVLAYEASSLGFGLYDELEAVGIQCHVLAPSRMERSPKQRRNKTDEKDALQILSILRGYYLAGNALPAIWIPDHATRDDRELLRARLTAQTECSRMKTRIRTLLKRNQVTRPEASGTGWTKAYREGLKALSECDTPLRLGARCALSSLLRQMEMLEQEVDKMDAQIEALGKTERYKKRAKALMALAGVGCLTALVFLTEIGDPRRFRNRRQLGAFLGLVPSAYESGETSDRKGRITRQGPARVRHVLCQAAWNRVRVDPQERAVYERIATKNPRRKKKALVAAMRRLAIRMWHAAVAA